MKDAWKDIIAQAIEKKWEGFQVVGFEGGVDDHNFRARVDKPTGSIKPDVSIKLNESISGVIFAYVKNYAKDEEELRINLESGKTVSLDDKESQPKIDREQLAKESKEKLISFRKNLPELIEGKTNPLLTKKKIKMFGKASNMRTSSWGGIINPIFVPFFNSLEEEAANNPSGGQIIGLDKNNKSQKTSVKDSLNKGTFHILQWGEKHPVFKNYDGFLSESYTTACDIAEAMPDNFVACSVGIGGQEEVGSKLSSSGINVIYVLDKKTAGEEPSRQESRIKNSYRPYIQLNIDEERLGDMTDFNDYAVKYGKGAVKKEIAIQSCQHLTVLPEVISYDADEGFTVLNPITQTLETMVMSKIYRFLELMSSPITAFVFRKAHGFPVEMEGDDLNAHLKPILLNAAARARKTIPRGVGVFKDTPGYVLNMMHNDRYSLLKGVVESTTKIRPFTNERYFNSPLNISLRNNENPEILKKDFTAVEFKKIITLWEKSFGLDRSHFLLLLGYMVQACYASFTTCTPHLWLRGVTGSGKSYILTNIINSLLNGLNMTLSDSSKAGVEQSLSARGSLNCPLIWLDEANMDTEKKKKDLTDLIVLTRAIFLGGLTPSFKGTQELSGKVFYRAFSMVMAATVDSLKDSQDIGRFLIMDVSNFKLKGEEYENVGREFLKINPYFLHAILVGSEHYVKMFNIITKKIESYYRIDRKKLGHKVASLAACVAGMAALAKVAYKWDDEKCADFALEQCAAGVMTQVQIHLEKMRLEDSFVDVLKRTYFQVGDMKGRLCDLCETSKESEMYESFGVYLRAGRKDSNGYNNLLINKTRFKLDALLSNPKQIIGTPIYNSLTKLWELKADHRDVSEEISTGARYFLIKRFCKVKQEV